MSRINGYNMMGVVLAVVVGVYSGTRFFEPLVVDQLKRDGNLRSDIAIPEYDSEGNPVEPKSIRDLRKHIEEASADGKKMSDILQDLDSSKND
ncbi:hypothetical protein TPHA_0B02250 [Tetrapisispora phaffii CBS 4417]|uniref:Protein ECM19 n=1 Tax=Tetrapisispora phaffii (strain ATCC 24235 / CBS 4417 / NBRC 1672 / NRRL Y-8282 / UCD 70-5) TaxID=1071381 RepID=G8BPG6_TETPH|nr:hypothetical protein TPHA_0B02250 [Tetrapisispora phaffii CBS 4417]CCE61897.1 hypothetical protein TPHA_0B02250 [Tetrapisispora phaffii CBS 4417]